MEIEKIYNEYYSMVYTVTNKILNNKMDTEDVVHDIFITIAQNIHTINEPKSLSGWIKRIAINKSLIFKRNSPKHIISIEKSDDCSIEQHIEIDYNVLKGIINKMPKQYQNVLVLKSEGYKHSEIAEQLGIQVGTTKSTLKRAKKYLSVRIPKPYNVYLNNEKNY